MNCRVYSSMQIVMYNVKSPKFTNWMSSHSSSWINSHLFSNQQSGSWICKFLSLSWQQAELGVPKFQEGNKSCNLFSNCASNCLDHIWLQQIRQMAQGTNCDTFPVWWFPKCRYSLNCSLGWNILQYNFQWNCIVVVRPNHGCHAVTVIPHSLHSSELRLLKTCYPCSSHCAKHIAVLEKVLVYTRHLH